MACLKYKTCNKACNLNNIQLTQLYFYTQKLQLLIYRNTQITELESFTVMDGTQFFICPYKVEDISIYRQNNLISAYFDVRSWDKA